ncbi:hypothetical protein [Metabacillus sp. RGM 3146]|uniref:hypothetical protein n=1 Tax=Metabacillus sp. RGM 3146 TaxID=3401092 RepID=UPI003B9989AF
MKAPIPVAEEDLIYEYIYLVYLITELEENRLSFERLPFKIPEPYVAMIDGILKALRLEAREMKKEMRNLKIKVLEEPQGDEIFFDY